MRCTKCSREHNFNFCPDCGAPASTGDVKVYSKKTTITKTCEWLTCTGIPVVASISTTRTDDNDSSNIYTNTINSLSVSGELVKNPNLIVNADEYLIEFSDSQGKNHALSVPSAIIEELYFDNRDKKNNKEISFRRHGFVELEDVSEAAFQDASPEFLPGSVQTHPLPFSVSSPSTNALTCPCCGSNHISIQFQQTGMTTRSRNSGCLWSICRGFLIFFTLGLWLLIGGRSGKSKTKVKSKKVAICQNCGNSWAVS